jgi:hypothetical protein
LVVVAANASPPVEIVVVDYANEGALGPVVRDACWNLKAPNTVRVPIYRGRAYYHMAHARNVSIRASTGEYVVITSTDIQPTEAFFPAIRTRVRETDRPDWLRPVDTHRRQPLASAFVGVIVCRRQALIDAGGYDEQFEFYGSEDKDLQARLERRGARWVDYSANPILTMDRTLNDDKVAHYREKHTKTTMMKMGFEILRKNVAEGRMHGNPDDPRWGEGWFINSPA